MIHEFFKDKPHIKIIDTVPHTPEWHKFRMDNGFGGSEIASVVSIKSKTLSDLVYTPAIKLHLLKCNEPIQDFTGNVESESGQFFEPIILNFYRSYDMDNPDMVAMYRNAKAGLLINEVLEPKVYITNEKYPWLFYSPDGFGRLNMTGPLRLLESKHTSSYETKRYAHKVSPAFYAQVQTGLMLTELDHADLLIFVDGKYFEVVTVEPDPAWFELIKDTSYQAWHNILNARIIKLKYNIPAYFAVNPDMFTEEQKAAIETLSALEPPLSGSEAELDFIKDLVVPPVEESIREGTEEAMSDCLEYVRLDDQEKEAKKSKQAVYERLLLHLGQGFNALTVGGNQIFSYRPDKRGTCRLLIDPSVKQAYSNKF